jgi:hypothetical protein
LGGSLFLASAVDRVNGNDDGGTQVGYRFDSLGANRGVQVRRIEAAIEADVEYTVFGSTPKASRSTRQSFD